LTYSPNYVINITLTKGEIMPRRRTSLKSQRASKTKHAQNLKTKQQLKRTIKKFQALVADKNSAEAKALLKSIFSQLDKASKKGVMHRGTTDRKKSRLSLSLAKAAGPAKA
jgi:small subunit ribosomal protein S20